MLAVACWLSPTKLYETTKNGTCFGSYINNNSLGKPNIKYSTSQWVIFIICTLGYTGETITELILNTFLENILNYNW